MLIPQRFKPPVNTSGLVKGAICNKTPRIRGIISRDANLTRSSRLKKYHRKPFHATMLCYAMLCKCYSTSFSIQSRVLFCSKAFFPPCSPIHFPPRDTWVFITSICRTTWRFQRQTVLSSTYHNIPVVSQTQFDSVFQVFVLRQWQSQDFGEIGLLRYVSDIQLRRTGQTYLALLSQINHHLSDIFADRLDRNSLHEIRMPRLLNHSRESG